MYACINRRYLHVAPTMNELITLVELLQLHIFSQFMNANCTEIYFNKSLGCWAWYVWMRFTHIILCMIVFMPSILWIAAKFKLVSLFYEISQGVINIYISDGCKDFSFLLLFVCLFLSCLNIFCMIKLTILVCRWIWRPLATSFSTGNSTGRTFSVMKI